MAENVNIESYTKLDTPLELKLVLPIPDNIRLFVEEKRLEVKQILNKKDSRKLFIVGPCSIHNIDEALEYGKKLKKLSEKVSDKILIVMRVYFEKPRTTIGWKGLINDPHLDGSCSVNYGLYLARRLLLDLNRMGVPCGYEILDTITPQFIADLITWGAIGARTTESQVHRQLVSGMSMPVGFKNGTTGNIKIAADAILSAKYPHCFMGITEKCEAAICKTKGNMWCHLILRGGAEGPNYFSKNIVNAQQCLRNNELDEVIMVDCSHGNSGKDYTNQPNILFNVINQSKDNSSIIGVMMESNLNEGNQKLMDGGIVLQKGVSITDSCISFEQTEQCILQVYKNLCMSEHSSCGY